MDSIANFLTQLRNAEMAGRSSVTVPASKSSAGLLAILKDNGIVAGFQADEGASTITVNLTGTSHSYKRVSKPGRRTYVGADSLPVVLGGKGFAIISTSSGLLSSKDAKRQGVGGEVICEVY